MPFYFKIEHSEKTKTRTSVLDPRELEGRPCRNQRNTSAQPTTLQQKINAAKLKFDALLIQEGIINERNEGNQIREKNQATIDMLKSEYGLYHF